MKFKDTIYHLLGAVRAYGRNLPFTITIESRNKNTLFIVGMATHEQAERNCNTKHLYSGTAKEVAAYMQGIRDTFVCLENEMHLQHPKGLASWIETHFEVVTAIMSQWDDIWQAGQDNNNELPECRISTIQAQKGHGGLYELAEELTNKFETINKDKEWDGEFFDEIENFLQAELKK